MFFLLLFFSDTFADALLQDHFSSERKINKESAEIFCTTPDFSLRWSKVPALLYGYSVYYSIESYMHFKRRPTKSVKCGSTLAKPRHCKN